MSKKNLILKSWRQVIIEEIKQIAQNMLSYDCAEVLGNSL